MDLGDFQLNTPVLAEGAEVEAPLVFGASWVSTFKKIRVDDFNWLTEYPQEMIFWTNNIKQRLKRRWFMVVEGSLQKIPTVEADRFLRERVLHICTVTVTGTFVSP